MISLKWRCLRCSHEYEGENHPEFCPNCEEHGEKWSVFAQVIIDPLELTVKQYMRTKLFFLNGEENIYTASKVMRENGAGSVIVTAEGKPVGIVTERDILYKVVAEDLSVTHVRLRKIMSSPLVTVPSHTTVRAALRIMRDKNFRRLIVTEDDKIVGIIAHRYVIGDLIGEQTRTQELE